MFSLGREGRGTGCSLLGGNVEKHDALLWEGCYMIRMLFLMREGKRNIMFSLGREGRGKGCSVLGGRIED